MINKLTLIFPHGTTQKIANQIANNAQEMVAGGVSEGGFETVSGNLMFDEKVEWSDDEMVFVYGHKRGGSDE